MKANELRLGNWVWNEVQNIPVKVDIRILQDQVYADKGFKEGWNPIPLTEEILFKGGFEKFLKGIKGSDIYDTYRLGVFQIENHFGTFVFHGVEIKYLHQLQNLFFAIVGKELEINL